MQQDLKSLIARHKRYDSLFVLIGFISLLIGLATLLALISRELT